MTDNHARFLLFFKKMKASLHFVGYRFDVEESRTFVAFWG
jgi:hypothetical protein